MRNYQIVRKTSLHSDTKDEKFYITYKLFNKFTLYIKEDIEGGFFGVILFIMAIFMIPAYFFKSMLITGIIAELLFIFLYLMSRKEYNSYDDALEEIKNKIKKISKSKTPKYRIETVSDIKVISTKDSIEIVNTNLLNH